MIIKNKKTFEFNERESASIFETLKILKIMLDTLEENECNWYKAENVDELYNQESLQMMITFLQVLLMVEELTLEEE